MMCHCLHCYCFHGVYGLVTVDAFAVAAGLVNNFAKMPDDATPMTCKNWMVDRLNWARLSNMLDMEPAMAPLMIKL